MLARQQQQLGKKQQRAAPAPVISGIQRLDNILDDQNVQRSIDKAAQQLEEFVAKNRDDQRTVLLGLPAIMGALLGGGPQNNAFSWLDEFRSRRTASIVNSTFVDIYTETAKDVLAELIFRHGSTACGEYQQRKSKSGTGSYGTRSSPRHHPTMLLLARSESASSPKKPPPIHCKLRLVAVFCSCSASLPAVRARRSACSRRPFAGSWLSASLIFLSTRTCWTLRWMRSVALRNLAYRLRSLCILKTAWMAAALPAAFASRSDWRRARSAWACRWMRSAMLMWKCRNRRALTPR